MKTNSTNQKHESFLTDSFGRIGKKLRISITDRCNLQCVYCMPKNNNNWIDSKDILTFDEMIRFASVMSKLGIENIRLTGGEPLLRSNIEILVENLSKITGIKKISMTTNGILLSDKISQLKKSGLSSINISLDTFNHEKFKKINGTDKLDQVLESIKVASKIQMSIKINNVVMRGWNDDEVVDFARFSKSTGHPVRFIEFMPLDGSGIWNENLVVIKHEIMSKIRREIGKLIPLDIDHSSPARSYTFSDGKGIIGFIPSISEPFCQNCDRVRITSDGHFLTCLFEKPGFDIKALLREWKSDKEMANFIQNCISKKPEGIIQIIRDKQLKPSLNQMNMIGG
ncbi:GTP 3',8-cyclase MoaA [Nitrosopumilus sp.]|uniref:GTP 3',8-cyclase MoaA n=1 Tax=Nitrosopumilus sp. TaxID=2024843 RepID=UPI00293123A9|nr:GTP 3',8-cyclase MoaA [Nitrosopumilus sp.]